MACRLVRRRSLGRARGQGVAEEAVGRLHPRRKCWTSAYRIERTQMWPLARGMHLPAAQRRGADAYPLCQLYCYYQR